MSFMGKTIKSVSIGLFLVSHMLGKGAICTYLKSKCAMMAFWQILYIEAINTLTYRLFHPERMLLSE